MEFAVCHGICRLPWNLLLAAEKRRTARFFATLTSNSEFFRLPFNFTIYKTIKSSHDLAPKLLNKTKIGTIHFLKQSYAPAIRLDSTGLDCS